MYSVCTLPYPFPSYHALCSFTSAHPLPPFMLYILDCYRWTRTRKSGIKTKVKTNYDKWRSNQYLFTLLQPYLKLYLYYSFMYFVRPLPFPPTLLSLPGSLLTILLFPCLIFFSLFNFLLFFSSLSLIYQLFTPHFHLIHS